MRRELQEEPSAGSIRFSDRAQSVQSLMIFACASPKRGLPVCTGVTPGFNLKEWGFAFLRGGGRVLVCVANTFSGGFESVLRTPSVRV